MVTGITPEYQNIITKGTFDYREIIKTLGIPSLKNLDVLDVGCSDGFFSKYFIEKLNASSVTGVDINKYDGDIAFEVLEKLRKTLKINTKNTMIFCLYVMIIILWALKIQINLIL